MEGVRRYNLLDVTSPKLLCGRILAFAWMIPTLARAQSLTVPGRDLLNFPIGLAAEAAAIGTQTASGIWNPAVIRLSANERWRLSVAAMNSSQDDLGAQAQLLSVARRWAGTTVGVSVLRANVTDLVRTDDSPLSIGDEIPYSTLLLSVAVARRVAEHVTAGLALRTRSGHADNITRTRASLDIGAVGEHIGARDARIGASTFLLPLPGGGADERLSAQVAADMRVAGADSLRAVRAGIALSHTARGASEQYLFATARWGRWDARGGPVRSENYAATDVSMRLGLSLRYGGYTLGVARDESANGLAPRYHFSLSSLLK